MLGFKAADFSRLFDLPMVRDLGTSDYLGLEGLKSYARTAMRTGRRHDQHQRPVLRAVSCEDTAPSLFRHQNVPTRDWH